MPTPSLTRDDRIALRITLSVRDSVRVLRLPEHPPKPPAPLVAAARRLRRNRK